MIELLERNSADKNKITVNIAVNYGGRNEIVSAVRHLAAKVEAGELKAQDITEKSISDNLLTAGLPDPDLIISRAANIVFQISLSGRRRTLNSGFQIFFGRISPPTTSIRQL